MIRWGDFIFEDRIGPLLFFCESKKNPVCTQDGAIQKTQETRQIPQSARMVEEQKSLDKRIFDMDVERREPFLSTDKKEVPNGDT